MMQYKIQFEIPPIQAMENLKGSLRNKILRKAINKASAPVKEAVISKAPSGKGNLKKSIKIKVKNYKNRDIWMSIIGPSSSFTRSVGKGKSKKKVRPAKYAGLVEWGTKYFSGRKFLDSAMNSTKQMYLDRLALAIKEKIAEELSK